MLKHYVAWLLAGALMASFATARAESEWTPSTYRLQIDMMAIGYSEKLSAVIIQSCKDTALDPRHCVITA